MEKGSGLESVQAEGGARAPIVAGERSQTAAAACGTTPPAGAGKDKLGGLVSRLAPVSVIHWQSGQSECCSLAPW